MKKIIFLTLILTLLLVACGGSTETAPSADTEAQFDPNSRELPLSTQLAIGTLKLEDTNQAVAPVQAADLLPLWQVLNSLTNSDTAAPEEIDAVIEQIQDTMTAEQLAAIDAMELTGQDIFATMQELGLTNAQVNAEGTPQIGGFGSGQRPEGGFPGGGGGSGEGGQELSPEQIATAQARRAENGGGAFGSRMLSPLTQAVIELLESKVQ